jgi:arylsulfatase A-like enzyme
VGFHGCKDVPTPHIDRLARAGMRFTNGYVSGAYCSPTRAGLLTGRYQQTFGHEFHVGRGEQGLPVTETTIADRLKAAGYVTGLVGKWHLGYLPQFHPQRRGFDEFFGFLGGGHSYFDSASLLRGTEKVEEREYLTDAFGREAAAFVTRHASRPWFLYLSFNAVHTPMEAPENLLARFASIRDPLAAAGIATRPEWKLDGVDLLPFVRGAKSSPPHEALYLRFGPQMAIRAGDYKLVRYDRNVDTRTGEIDQPVSPAKLYHLSNDIGETRDLMKLEPAKARELQAKWDAWNATLIKPLWGRGTVAEEGADPAAARKRERRKEK